MFKKAISVIAALTLAITGVCVYADSEKTAENTPITDSGAVLRDYSYSNYQADNSSYNNSASDAVLKTEAAKEGVTLSDAGDSVSFEFYADENGWYEPLIVYTPVKSTGGDIEIALTVDGKSVCSQFDNILLHRIYS